MRSDEIRAKSHSKFKASSLGLLFDDKVTLTSIESKNKDRVLIDQAKRALSGMPMPIESGRHAKSNGPKSCAASLCCHVEDAIIVDGRPIVRFKQKVTETALDLVCQSQQGHRVAFERKEKTKVCA